MWTNRTLAINLIRWWPTILSWPQMTVGAKRETYWHRCWPCSRCEHCFHFSTTAAWNCPITWRQLRRIKIWKRKHLPPDLQRKMWFGVRSVSIRSASPTWNLNSVTWARKSSSQPHSAASNWCWCPFAQFYVTSCHLREYLLAWVVLRRRGEINLWLWRFICRFVPGEVDRWFRELIHELKEDRMKSPLEQEDLFQMILNCSDKMGKIHQSPQPFPSF